MRLFTRAVGAMVPSDEELQLLQLPITLVIVAAFLLYPAVMRDPTSRLAIVVSLIPFLSPILMLFRIALQTPPFWQIALSLALCIGTTIGVVRCRRQDLPGGHLDVRQETVARRIAPLAEVHINTIHNFDYAAFPHFHFVPPMRVQGCRLLLPAHVLLQPRLQQLLHDLRTRNHQAGRNAGRL